MKIECGLTDGVYGFIFMTGAARQPCSKSSAAQSCSRAAAAVQRTCQSRRRVGARMFDLASAGPSLYPNRATAETANPGERKQAGVYGETATQLDSTRTAVCTRQQLPLSEVVTGALRALVQRGRGLGEPKPI